MCMSADWQNLTGSQQGMQFMQFDSTSGTSMRSTREVYSIWNMFDKVSVGFYKLAARFEKCVF